MKTSEICEAVSFRQGDDFAICRWSQPSYFQVNQLLAMVSYLVSKQVMQFSFKIRAEVHAEN